MWFFLGFAVICFTIVVLFRMFMDMRMQEQRHNRLMRSDQRDYERYIDVKSKENPQPALPDFSKALAPMPIPPHEIRYWSDGELPSARQLSEVQRIYLEAQMRDYIEREQRKQMNRNWS